MTTSIHSLIMEAVRDEFQAQLIDAIADETKAGLVKVGHLQDDPTEAEVNFMIHPGDENWRHALNTNVGGPDAHTPFAYTIGGPYGSASWRRRYTVEMDFYFDGELDRNVARKKALVILQRAHTTLMKMAVSVIPRDSFGERAHFIQVYDSYLVESGGEGTFIWSGELRFEVITELEPTG